MLFSLQVLSITEKGVLRFPILIVGLFLLLIMSVFASCHFRVFLGVWMFIFIMPSWWIHFFINIMIFMPFNPVSIVPFSSLNVCIAAFQPLLRLSSYFLQRQFLFPGFCLFVFFFIFVFPLLLPHIWILLSCFFECLINFCWNSIDWSSHPTREYCCCTLGNLFTYLVTSLK